MEDIVSGTCGSFSVSGTPVAMSSTEHEAEDNLGTPSSINIGSTEHSEHAKAKRPLVN